MDYVLEDCLYDNPLSRPSDVADFRVEGHAALTFPRGHMRMENARERDKEAGHHANFILWCPETFPADIAVSWEFRPRTDAGLAMVWIAAAGRSGEDLVDPSLAPRDGDYPQYFRGDINALHCSYYRRNPGETTFRTCNLRKSYGFHLVAQGADPLPDSQNAPDFYAMQVIKCGPVFRFTVNDLLLLHWEDDGETTGPVLGGGKIGFRQMAGLIADYRSLTVHAVRAAS